MNSLRDSSTGMLLIHDGVLMHYLEAPASACVELLREAQELGRSRPTFGAVCEEYAIILSIGYLV